MISRSTILHLRFPFSIFLLPVFLFALSISNKPGPGNVLLVFFIVHLLLYPASNGYNSYFDKDEKSIGGLKHPPKVRKDLYYTSLALDMLAIVLGLFINIQFAIMLLIYGLVSKAYSHPAIRLKKLPITSWLTAGIFQGFFTFLMIFTGLNDYGLEIFFEPTVLIPATLSTGMLMGSYPMTQIYQHEEDSKRGDITLSIKLGVLGTFYFTGIFFTLITVAFVYYYIRFFGLQDGLFFILFIVPMAAFFIYWYALVRKDSEKANFDNAMRLNLISSVCLGLFFIWESVRYC